MIWPEQSGRIGFIRIAILEIGKRGLIEEASKGLQFGLLQPFDPVARRRSEYRQRRNEATHRGDVFCPQHLAADTTLFGVIIQDK